MRQIISGLAFLHGKHIAHRDLKPERVGFWCLFWVLSCAGFCAVGLWCLECFFFGHFFEGMSKNPFRIQISTTSTSIGSPDGDCHQQYERGTVHPPHKNYQQTPPSVLTIPKGDINPLKVWLSMASLPPQNVDRIHYFQENILISKMRQADPPNQERWSWWSDGLPRMQTKLGMWCTTRKRLQWQDMTARRRSRRQLDKKKGFSHKIKYNPYNLHQSFVLNSQIFGSQIFNY